MSEPLSPFVALREKEFRLFIIQRFFFTMSMRMIITVVAWKLYIVTKNPLAIAFIGLSEAIPAISLALYSGHVVDKSDKRTLIVRLILLYMLCAAAMFYVVMPQTENNHGKQIIQYSIYGIMFCTGIRRSSAAIFELTSIAGFRLVPLLISKMARVFVVLSMTIPI